jgi:hypothetical protein
MPHAEDSKTFILKTMFTAPVSQENKPYLSAEFETNLACLIESEIPLGTTITEDTQELVVTLTLRVLYFYEKLGLIKPLSPNVSLVLQEA